MPSQNSGLPGRINAIALMTNGDILAITGCGLGDDLVHFDRNGKVVSRVPNIVSSAKNDSVVVFELHPAVDGLGNLFIADSSSSAPYVYQYSPAGKYVNRFGGRGKQLGQFGPFIGPLAIDGQSRVYVRDTNTVDVFDATGRFVTIIDSALYGGSALDLAINQATNEIYVVGSKDKIYKLALNAAK